MNKEFCYSFHKPLTSYQGSELNRKVWYLSEHLINYSLVFDNSMCTGIRFSIEESEYDDFINYLKKVLENDIYELRNIDSKALWSVPTKDYLNEDQTMEALVNNKLVCIHGEGQVSIKYPLTELYEFLDLILKHIAIENFAAEQFIFPTLIKSSVLQKAGYFDSFPNLWTFVSRLHNDYHNYSSFKADTDKLHPDNLRARSCVTNYSLPPTMCYYVYDMLSGSIIENRTITTRGKSFRFENRYCKNMSRLWDFTIREIVFLGSKEYVENSLTQFRISATNLMDKIGLSGKCVYANDPFYLTDNAAKRINVQKMYHSKIELRLDTSDNETIAIASFNRHNQYISSHFGLYATEEKSNIFTGCIGFGLERFMFAFLCQYGIDETKWPVIIKENYLKNNREAIAIDIAKKCFAK